MTHAERMAIHPAIMRNAVSNPGFQLMESIILGGEVT
jgi:hypothetical protein